VVSTAAAAAAAADAPVELGRESGGNADIEPRTSGAATGPPPGTFSNACRFSAPVDDAFESLRFSAGSIEKE